MPRGTRRRTPGLRRSEVALLAGVSLEWYTWLEQARDITVSAQLLESLAREETVSENVEEEYEDERSFGERAADVVADFGGSWNFIGLFTLVLVVWMAFNVWAVANAIFDPYPFILLNLVLSCLAAVQAPIIMMSQKRQEAKDRLRSENDYKVNLKAELEIRHLHDKVDHIITRQWERLAEIQQIQLEIMQDMAASRR